MLPTPKSLSEFLFYVSLYLVNVVKKIATCCTNATVLTAILSLSQVPEYLSKSTRWEHRADLRMVARAGVAAKFTCLVHSHMLRHDCGHTWAMRANIPDGLIVARFCSQRPPRPAKRPGGLRESARGIWEAAPHFRSASTTGNSPASDGFFGEARSRAELVAG